jgi:hypothetical protein
MDADLTLAQLLRLRAAIDAALACGVPVGDEDVQALLELFDQLDRSLRRGARVPTRWSSAALRAQPQRVTHAPERPRAPARVSLDASLAPSNDNAARRRRARVRGGLRRDDQLALPWLVG